MPNFSCFKKVSQEEIRKIIMKSPSKSCLLDTWPTFLVKECIDILLPSITRLVNCSLSEGVVPDEFKKAIVTPLIKKSSLPPNDLKNYRPVSRLGFISKLVERVVAFQLNDHVSVNGLENVRQSAYKLDHSTESVLLLIKNDVHLAFAKFIYLFGGLRHFQHYTCHITTGSWKGRGNQYIQFIRVLYCKLPTNGKQLPAFPLQAVTGIESRPQRWEARVLPLCHRGPWLLLKVRLLLSFSWINQQRLILLIMIRFLILSAPGSVSAGLSSIGSCLISQTMYSALR